MLRLKIVSPDKVMFDGDVQSVLVPGSLGSFEILTDHAPIISSLEKGKVEYATDEGRTGFEINGRFVVVKKNEVSLCVELNHAE